MTLTFKDAELLRPVPSRLQHRGHPRREERRDEATQPGRHRALQARRTGTRARRLTLDAWDGYRDAAKVAIKHATFKFISDPAAEAAAVLAGDVDAFPRVAAASLDQFKADPRFQVMVGGTEGKTILGINNKKPPLDDLKVRQAIAYAIDRKAIIDGAVERPRHADRQPSDAQRSRLCRPDRAYIRTIPPRPRRCWRRPASRRRSVLTLTLPPPPYARQGGEIIAAELAEIGIAGEDRERRMGAVALQRLHQQELRSDDHQPCRAARHRHLRQPELLLPVRQQGLPGDHRALERRARPRRLQEGAWSTRSASSPTTASTASCSSFRTPSSPTRS